MFRDVKVSTGDRSQEDPYNGYVVLFDILRFRQPPMGASRYFESH
ncbi:hypothetical protein [Ktedonospora formicarum]|nr:hypothetical protein [Ktedonospora formicarum]